MILVSSFTTSVPRTLALLLAASSCVAACSADDGMPGATGATGATGAAGPTGPEGPPGAVATPTAATPPSDAPPSDAPPAVYTLSNDPTENAVVVYARAADGTPSLFGSFSTGGRGTGAGLGDQGALLFDEARKAFFAVNAGDSTISMLALRSDGSLALVSKVPSGGAVPISLTLTGGRLYAVNAGDDTHPANIAGFTIAAGGMLPLPNSTRALSTASPAPAQIQASPDGKVLVVTEKGTNLVDTFVVTDGIPGEARAQASSGMTPFGFAFTASGTLVVSEAFGGATGKGATSSYALAADGTLSAKSTSAASTQTAPCWVTISGAHAYVTNTGSNTITTYTVAADGSLVLEQPNGVSAQTGDGPADDAPSPKGDFLYTRNGRDHSLSIFAVAASGALTKKGDFAGLPLAAAGLVVR